MDPFGLLKADHKKVAELFDMLEAASGKRKLDVFKSIKSELAVHIHIEETFLYPALKKPRETHDLTLEAYEEHNVIKTLLAELSGARSATDVWQAKAKVLRENVEHHVDEEENEMFDKADDALSDEEIEALGQRMAAEKARKEGKPVPKKPEVKMSKKKTAKPGIISRIANFVGLGDNGAEKKTSRLKTAKKASPKKKTAASRSSSTARKPSSQTARKRASATIGSKRISGPKSASKKQSAASSGTKTAKKRAGRK